MKNIILKIIELSALACILIYYLNGGVSLSFAESFSYEIDRIYYLDNVGREYDYDFYNVELDPTQEIAMGFIPDAAVISRSPEDINFVYCLDRYSATITALDSSIELSVSATPFEESSGHFSIGGTDGITYSNTGVPQISGKIADEWIFSAELFNFQNVSNLDDSNYGFWLGFGTWDQTKTQFLLHAGWFSGTYDGNNYDKIFHANLKIWNTDEGWEWKSEDIMLENIDPDTTRFVLKVHVEDMGSRVTGYLKINDNEWQMVGTYTIPQNQGTCSGFAGSTYPTIGIGFDNINDVATMASQFGRTDCQTCEADINKDGYVDGYDLFLLLN